MLNIIKSRRTVRKYKDMEIPSKIIENIIEAGRWAPSAHNIQPWKFIVITDSEKIHGIRSMMLKKEKDLLAGFNIVMTETSKCLETSPALIAIYSNGGIKNRLARFGEPYSRIGKIYEIQSISLALGNMMLYSKAAGIGSACLGMALFCGKEINRLLHQKGELVALLSLGFPYEGKTVSTRKAIPEIVEFI